MQVSLKRIPKGVSLRYFDINSTDCRMIWEELRLPKILYLKETKTKIKKPKNFLAFTAIIHSFSYSYDLQTQIVKKLTIYETIVVFLPKLKQFYLISSSLKSRWLRFLKLSKLHEKIYHFDLYKNKQRYYLINSLKTLKKPTKRDIDNWIKAFNKKIVKEQELSHLRAPKAEYICSKDYLAKVLLY